MSFDLGNYVDHEYQPAEDGAQDHYLGALSCGRDNARTTRLGEVDGSADQGLDITRAAHVRPALRQGRIFRIYGDPSRSRTEDLRRQRR